VGSLEPTPLERRRRRRRLKRRVRAVVRIHRQLCARYNADAQLREWFIRELTDYCTAILCTYSSEKARSKWASRYESPAGVLESAP
jgi:hypothetical protein